MALSFGRKKGQATNEADSQANGTAQPASIPAGQSKSTTGDEPIDESWFETFSEEAATQNASAPAPDFSVPAATAQPQFSAYDTQNQGAADDFGDFGSDINVPASATAHTNTQSGTQTGPQAAFDAGVFVDPSSGTTGVSGDSTTPFDTTSTVGGTTTSEAKKGGGLKKLLPILAVLLILGGGGAFWMTQQGGEEDTGEFPPVSTSPVTSSATSPAMTQPTGAVPATAPPATGAPTGASPTGASPTGAAPDGAKSGTSSATGDPKIKAQLKKLWNEGLALRLQNKTAAAKAKWNQAVKLARSKPAHQKSADMIQQAIDKLK